MNATADNFRLRPNSPCIDAGMDLSETTTVDLAGNPRPLDGDGDGVASLDIGAYEYDGRPADSNGDGIPDGWCRRHGLEPMNASVATADPDHDGHTTYQEWVADTDPTDAASVLRLTAISPGPPVSVSVPSSAGRLYTLESCADLSSGDWIAVPGATAIPGTGGLLTLSDPKTGPSRFYRVSVRLP